MLQDKLRQLAELNRSLEENQVWLETKEENLKRLPEYQDVESVRNERDNLKAEIDTVRAEVNALTLESYLLTDNKKPAPGVGIRIVKTMEYSEQVAFDYCFGNLHEALKLDKRTFEKYAKGVQDVKPLDFVTFDEKVTATIASDLTEYLDV